MWEKSYSKTYKDVYSRNVWEAWTDVENWHKWKPSVESCRMDGKFVAGNVFFLKPEGYSETRIEILESIPEKKFVDITNFWGAQMIGTHEITESEFGLKITISVKIDGWLGFIWQRLVGDKVASQLQAQADGLIDYVRGTG